jgi:hypothetical protein
MINLKTLIKTVYRNGRYFYHQGVKDYHLFTDAQIMIFIKENTHDELFKELSNCVNRKGTINNGYLEKVLETFLDSENNINSIYKADSNYTLIDSEDGKITWFASRLLACISKRYKSEKEFVKNTPTPKHDNFRIYYKGNNDLFVAILPVYKSDNDGVTYKN